MAHCLAGMGIEELETAHSICPFSLEAALGEDISKWLPLRFSEAPSLTTHVPGLRLPPT